MKLNNNKKNIIIMSLILVEVASMFLLYKSLSDKKTQIDEVAIKENNIVNKNMFAIMLQQSDGNYTKSSSDTFPISGYVLNETLSGCTDKNGNKINNALIKNGNEITLRTKQTSYCYYYFDKV